MVGTSGSGKTTVGRALAARLGLPFVELDAIFHQPGWTELPREDFRELWNGNRESLKFLFSPTESILWWAWTQHRKYTERYAAAMQDPTNAHLAFIRVRSRADARALLLARHQPDRQ